jgi:hypothetical protein
MAGTPGSHRHLGCHSTDVGHRGEREGGGCVRRSRGIAHVWNTSTPPANPVKLLTHAAINALARRRCGPAGSMPDMPHGPPSTNAFTRLKSDEIERSQNRAVVLTELVRHG